MVAFSRHALSVYLIALSLCIAANWASAQVNTADILGTVTDAGGAVIPNVKVTVTNTATNDTKTTTTNTTPTTETKPKKLGQKYVRPDAQQSEKKGFQWSLMRLKHLLSKSRHFFPKKSR